MSVRLKWVNQIREEIVEPDRPIVDPHHHFWMESRWGRYLLDDLWADTESGHRIEKTVFLECGAEYCEDGPDAMSLSEKPSSSPTWPPGQKKGTARRFPPSSAMPTCTWERK